MDHDIEIPKQVPVMTLPNTVLFPQAILPLYIFEPRYRQMLSDVLDSHRIFVVAGLNQQLLDVSPEQELKAAGGKPEDDYFEPPYEMATAGVIRACHENEDGTSNLIIQGLVRVKFESIVTETPYRMADINPQYSEIANPSINLDQEREILLELLKGKQGLGGGAQKEIFGFLEKIHDPDIFIDLAAFSLAGTTQEKQNLLETLDTDRRYATFKQLLNQEIDQLKLYKQLRGDLKDDDILNN